MHHWSGSGPSCHHGLHCPIVVPPLLTFVVIMVFIIVQFPFGRCRWLLLSLSLLSSFVVIVVVHCHCLLSLSLSILIFVLASWPSRHLCYSPFHPMSIACGSSLGAVHALHCLSLPQFPSHLLSTL